MSLIDWFAARRKDQFVGKVSQDTDEGDGLWVKCSECSQVAYRKDLISNFYITFLIKVPNLDLNRKNRKRCVINRLVCRKAKRSICWESFARY